MRPAVMEDAERILELVNYYAGQGDMLPRTAGDIYERIRDFVVLEEDGKLIGCGALRVYWKDLGEIRSLALEPAKRRQGYGHRLVQHLLEEAGRLGLKRVFALTYQVEFFERQGFTSIEKEALPYKIWTDCVICPKSAHCDEIAMITYLDEEA